MESEADAPLNPQKKNVGQMVITCGLYSVGSWFVGRVAQSV
jgi:hypothetical protein